MKVLMSSVIEVYIIIRWIIRCMTLILLDISVTDHYR